MPTKNKELLGKNVADARTRANMTQKKLAHAVGVSIRHIQEIEYGRTDIKLSVLEKIAEKLGLEPFQLFTPTTQNELSFQSETCPLKFPNIRCPADNIQVALQITDSTGTVIFSTSQSSLYLGYTRSEICSNMKIWDFVAEEEEKLSLRSYFSHLLTHKIRPLPISTTTLKKDGTKIPVIMDWNYLKGTGQNIAGILSVIVPR